MAVDVSKVDQGYVKMYVGSSFVVGIVDNQGEVIGRFHQTIHNFIKGVNIMSAKMGGVGQDFHNMGKEMEYYAAKLIRWENALR